MNSVEFLQAFHPDGPWVLTAIRIDRKGIETITFGPDTKEEAAKWISDYNGKRNLYFSVNLPGRPLTKKATREDIASVPWLHVDVDARAGEPLEEELLRIEKLLVRNCPVQAPTVIVFSGGGYQAFWKLEEAISVTKAEQADEIASYNKQLEIVLEGDNCSNIDRIMRLPGTTNIPNAKKVEKGRTAVESAVVYFDVELSYPLAQFTAAPGLQTPGIKSGATIASVATTNIARLDSVEELDKWKVPDRVKVIIVQGHHPDEPKEGDNSRSAWVFDAVCQLVRCEVPDEVIYSVLTDPDFGISSSILDKGSNAEKYALRQMQRAKEEVEEPWLRILNEEYFVCTMVGKTRIMSEAPSPVGNRFQLVRQTFTDFKQFYANQFIMVGKRSMCVADWWFKHPRRRQFKRLIFDPGSNDPECYNLWQGFACSAIPGENHEAFLSHVKNNICSGNEEHYNYMIGWLARCVQKPGAQGEAAVVLRGKSGTGKSFFAKSFGSLWGRHYLQVSDGKHLVGSFNAHQRDVIVLFGDEAFYAGDKKHESVLKTLITEDRIAIEAKGVDVETSPNFIHLILASNSDWVVPAGPMERRFFVLDVADDHQQDSDYFQKIQYGLDNGGREALLFYLINYDLMDFNVRKVPATNALTEQKKHTLDPLQSWWLWRLEEGTLLSAHDSWETKVPTRDLIDDYVKYVQDFMVSYRGTRLKVAMFLKKTCPEGWPKRFRESAGAERPYFYEFPPLRHCREKWVQVFGPTEWDRENTEAPQDEPF